MSVYYHIISLNSIFLIKAGIEIILTYLFNLIYIYLFRIKLKNTMGTGNIDCLVFFIFFNILTICLNPDKLQDSYF